MYREKVYMERVVRATLSDISVIRFLIIMIIM